MTKGNYNNIKLEQGMGMPLGAFVLDQKRIQFSVSVPDAKDITLHLFPGNDDNAEIVIDIDRSYQIGTIFSIIVPVPDSSDCTYLFEKNSKYFCDPYAREIAGREEWGKGKCKEELGKTVRARVLRTYPPVRRAEKLDYKLSDLYIYRLHVRGFTMDSHSGVKDKGTFSGIIEKIPYLKELGINAIELMPCYEFNEVQKQYGTVPYGISSSITKPAYYEIDEENAYKINFWGYTDESNYFAPKSSYCVNHNQPKEEFKWMVQQLQKAGIEVYMEFYFAYNTNQNLILDCLRYWQQEYNIDGFKLNKDWIPEKLIATDPILSHAKLFTSEWNLPYLFPDGLYADNKKLAEYNDSFLVSARRYLKGDEEQVEGFAGNMKANPCHKGKINYLGNTNHMTLMDMVSYDVKHNEENGEHNRDGTDYNYSWNCGWEGKTRKKAVLELRKRQIKNALILLFFSQGTPLIMAGDEFGNSQEGNNNPYCIDSPLTWLDWNQLKKNSWMFLFMKKLIAFRKQHKILHMDEELKGMDYISCGCPDISFHGTKAWYPDFSNYSRELGILLCGRYAMQDRISYDKDFYIACNFHWEAREFCLPHTRSGALWSILIDTSDEEMNELCDNGKVIKEKVYKLKPRTVVVFMESEQRI